MIACVILRRLSINFRLACHSVGSPSEEAPLGEGQGAGPRCGSLGILVQMTVVKNISKESLGIGAGTQPSSSPLQQAGKSGSNCSSKAGSGSESVRKQTVFGKMRGKMKDTIT